MAEILATGQVSIVDLTDNHTLSGYIATNMPRMQVYDPGKGGTVVPDWSTPPGLTQTPIVFVDQTAIATNDPGLTITWRRKEGIGMESGLVVGESVANGILTVSQNLLGDIESGMLTYYAYIRYEDPATDTQVDLVADITFTQIQSGVQGESPVILTLYAPEGNVFLDGTDSLPIQASAYKGTQDIAEDATFAWFVFVSGSWRVLPGETADMLLVSADSVPGLCSYRCEMTYDGATYIDTISMMDRTDSYQATIESTGGDVFVGGTGETLLTCRLFQNGSEVDLVLNAPIAEAPPALPLDGDLWYRIIRPNSVILHRYDGDQARWMTLAPEDRSEMQYAWFRIDKDGHSLDTAPWQVGKMVFVNAGEIDVKVTYRVEVDHWQGGVG